jgi:hypothetical protein
MTLSKVGVAGQLGHALECSGEVYSSGTPKSRDDMEEKRSMAFCFQAIVHERSYTL